MFVCFRVNIEFQKLKDENSSKMAGMSAQMKKLTLENANLKRAIQQKVKGVHFENVCVIYWNTLNKFAMSPFRNKRRQN